MKKIAVAAFFLLSTSCVSTPPIPPELQYTQPTGDLSNLASISATIIDSKVPLVDNENSYVYAIDGKRVMVKKKDWALPIAVSAGARTITAGFEQGVYMAFAKVEASLVAGHKYQVRSSCDKHAIGNPYTYCDFWVVDSATDTAVSDIARGPVGGRPPPTVLYLPR